MLYLLELMSFNRDVLVRQQDAKSQIETKTSCKQNGSYRPLFAKGNMHISKVNQVKRLCKVSFELKSFFLVKERADQQELYCA